MEDKEVISEAIALLQKMLEHHPNLVLYSEAVKLYRSVPALIELLRLGESSSSSELFAAVSRALLAEKENPTYE